MGYTSATDMAEQVGAGSIGLDSALYWHLTTNCYPPLPVSMIAVAAEAIELASCEQWDDKISMPDDIMFRYRDEITVAEAVEAMHLEGFIATGEEYDYEEDDWDDDDFEDEIGDEEDANDDNL